MNMSWSETEEEKESRNAPAAFLLSIAKLAVRMEDLNRFDQKDDDLPLFFVILEELCSRRGNAIDLSEVPKLFENNYGQKLQLGDRLWRTLRQGLFSNLCYVNIQGPPRKIYPTQTLERLLYREYQHNDVFDKKLTEAKNQCTEVETRLAETMNKLLDARNKLELATERPEDKLTKMLSDELTCVVCLDTLSDAVESECCMTLCCLSCSISLLKCPMCRRDVRWRSNAAIRRLVHKMPVKCDANECSSWSTRAEIEQHKEHCDFVTITCLNNECSFTAKRKDFKPHIDTCQFALIACSHCQQQMVRKNVEAHEANCEERIVKCSMIDCSTKVKHKDMAQHHDVCDFVPITCTHEGCAFTAQRQYMKEHLNTCGEAAVACTFCNYTFRRRVVVSHERICYRDHIQCRWCVKYVRKYDIRQHNNVCPEAPIPCQNQRCNQRIMPRNMNHHVKEECGWTIAQCRWNGCDGMYTRNDLQNHEECWCDQREVTCHHCGHNTTRIALNQHLRVCKNRRRYSPY